MTTQSNKGEDTGRANQERLNKELLQKMADLLTDAILIINKKRRIIFANAAAQQLIGKPTEEIEGEELEILFNLEHIESSSHIMRLQLPKNGTLTIRTHINDIPHLINILRIDMLPQAEELCADACGLVTITQEPPVEQDLDPAAAIYTQILGFLTLRISHDFNNSLTSIIGNAQLVEEALNTLSKGQVEDAQASAQRALPIIQDVVRKSLEMGEFVKTLQDYARQQPFTREALDINTAVRDTLAIARRILGQKIKVEFLQGSGIPPILIERALFHQVVFGLLVNCKEVMPRGGRVTIETDLARLDLEFADNHPGSRPGEYIRLSITDSGAGMDKESLIRIFDPAFPGKISEKSTGLSLPTVYAIVKQNGGYIEVESWPGKGTHFDVYLPTSAHAQIPEEPTKKSEQQQTEEKGDGTAKKSAQNANILRSNNHPLILIAEDEDDVSRYIERDVTKAGYRAALSGRGDTALELYKTLSEKGDRPALVIADLGLPGIDGRNLLKKIREVDKDAAVLLTSGYRIDSLEETGKTEEGYDFIQKPFESAVLLRRIEKILTAA